MAKIAPSEDLVRKNELVNFCTHLSRSSTTIDHAILRTKAYDAVRFFRSHLVARSRPVEWSQYARDLTIGAPRLAYETARILSSRASSILNPGRNTHFDLHQMTEQLPNRNSRVTLGKTVDALGQRRARLDWQLQQDDIDKFVKGQALMAKEFAQSGVGRLIPYSFDSFPPRGIRGGYHHMGTTRMSLNSKDGVVDSNCRVHGNSNLYIAGSSVFPTSGFANPTFTIAALAIRLGDHLKNV